MTNELFYLLFLLTGFVFGRFGRFGRLSANKESLQRNPMEKSEEKPEGRLLRGITYLRDDFVSRDPSTIEEEEQEPRVISPSAKERLNDLEEL